MTCPEGGEFGRLASCSGFENAAQGLPAHCDVDLRISDVKPALVANPALVVKPVQFSKRAIEQFVFLGLILLGVISPLTCVLWCVKPLYRHHSFVVIVLLLTCSSNLASLSLPNALDLAVELARNLDS